MAFNIVFYQNTAEPNRVDKTSFLTSIETLTGTLREPSSIINPSITIQRTNVPNYNYAYIAQFNRYYFIAPNGITSVGKNLWKIDLQCDVLMSFKTGILALSAVVGRQENNYNAYLVDSQLPVEKEPETVSVVIPSSAFNNTPTYDPEQQIYVKPYNYVLTVVGRGDT